MATERFTSPVRDIPTRSPADPDVPAVDAAASLSTLTVTCDEREGLVLVSLAGHLDIYTAPHFRMSIRRFDPSEVQLVVDLTGVVLLDSAGIGELVMLRNAAHRVDGQLGLVCPEHRVTRVFWAAGLRPVFAFGDDLAAVLAAVAARRRARRWRGGEAAR
ncbi:MAG: STAS domain-containing protein [Actinomycetota bacterium]